MPFKTGKQKTGGRQKGSLNKTTTQLRELLSDFLQEKFGAVSAAFDELKPRDKVKAYIDLLQYGLPRLSSESANPFESMDEETLNQIVEKLKSEYE